MTGEVTHTRLHMSSYIFTAVLFTSYIGAARCGHDRRSDAARPGASSRRHQGEGGGGTPGGGQDDHYAQGERKGPPGVASQGA